MTTPLKVMFMDVRILYETTHESGMPIPDVGDDVELNASLYTVVARTWSVAPYAVVIYVRER